MFCGKFYEADCYIVLKVHVCCCVFVIDDNVVNFMSGLNFLGFFCPLIRPALMTQTSLTGKFFTGLEKRLL